MTAQQLIPKPPRRKRQPSAEVMRQQLALAADEIIRLREQLAPFEYFESIVRDSAGRHSHSPPARSPPPPPAPPPPRDVTGRTHPTWPPGAWMIVEDPQPRPWWRRILRSNP